MLISERWASVGSESVRDGYSILLETALLLVKIDFKFNHALAGATHGKVLCAITVLAGRTPKFTCISL